MKYELTFRSEPFPWRDKFDEYGLFETEALGLWQGETSHDNPDYIRWVQSSLNKLLGLRLAVDGLSGPSTRSAIRRLQQQNGLTADGRVGAMTEQALIRAGVGNPPSHSRSPAQIPAAPLPTPSGPSAGFLKDLPELQTVNLLPSSPVGIHSGWPSTRRTVAGIYNQLGGLMHALAGKTQVEIAAVLAVWKVESGNLPHNPGKAVIRFENHLLYRRWGQRNDATYTQYFRHGSYRGQSGSAWENHQFHEDPSQPLRSFHGNQQAEYQVLRLATRLAGEESALQCISIGGPQILISNYALIGYRTPRSMYDAFQASERSHVLGFFDFCQQTAKEKGGLLPYLRAKDFRSFARYYNGPGQVDYYGGKIQEAYNEARQLSLEQSEAFETEWADMEWQGEWEDAVNRGSPEYIRWVQSSLNKVLGLRLTVDGIAGPAMRSVIRSFQQQKGLRADGIVEAMTEAALIQGGAIAPPGGSATPDYSQPYPRPSVSSGLDPTIEALNLAEPARNAAYKIKAKHPWVVFTSGRRDLSGQARAMASNVVKNRKWIAETYVASPIIAAAQKWVDSHPEARTQQAIADGLLGVFQSFPASEIGRISRHLVGLAFDIQPVTSRLPEIEPTIRSLPGLTKFLTKEGGLTIWHIQL